LTTKGQKEYETSHTGYHSVCRYSNPISTECGVPATAR